MAVYRTFVMAGRMMTLVIDGPKVHIITGEPATQAEINTEDYKAEYIPREAFI